MCREAADFEKCLALMRRYSRLHEVAIHGYCLLHNHGHWILEASTPESLRYVELNSVEANLAEEARDWPWSSAPAHCAGTNPNLLLIFDRWQHLFGRPETIAVDWYRYLDESADHDRAQRDWVRRWAMSVPSLPPSREPHAPDFSGLPPPS